jgi:hypothetical protein
MRPADTRHRGPHPADDRLFAPQWIPTLCRTVEELSWLLTRGYPPASTLKLVGDCYALTERQRWAVGRAANWLNLAALALAAEPSYWLINLSVGYKDEAS